MEPKDQKMILKSLDIPVLAGINKRDDQRFLIHQKMKESKSTKSIVVNPFFNSYSFKWIVQFLQTYPVNEHRSNYKKDPFPWLIKPYMHSSGCT